MTIESLPSLKLFARPVLALTLLFAAACSDSGGNRSNSAESIILVDLLPVTTRGLYQLQGDAALQLESSGQAQLTGTLPWRQAPLDILRLYSGLMNLLPVTEQVILAQTTQAIDGFIVLADAASEDVDALVEQAQATEAGTYRGQEVYSLPGSNLLLTRLGPRTLAIAPRSNLEPVIDVYSGEAADIHGSQIAGHLSVLDSGQPVSAVYGLPALYREVSSPGNGASSLNQATVVKAAFGFEDDTSNGKVEFVSDNAEVFTERLLGLLKDKELPEIQATEDTISVDLTGFNAGDALGLLKTFFVDMNVVDYNEAVAYGGNVPWLNFNVGGDPNSIFINFEFRSESHRKAFTAAHLPQGFTLAPIRILESEAPRYFLVVNIYQSSGGLVEGARAEWSVFVHDPDSGQPRFLVVQAAAENISADPVNLFTFPEPVSHDLEADAIASYVGVEDPDTQEESLYFSSRINWPQPPERQVSFHREFVVANDFIFWGNAVADRGLYNSTVHNRNAVKVPAGDLSLTDRSVWSAYVNKLPVHTVAYLNPLDIVISTWWNLDEDYLDVTPEHRQALIGFKDSFYPSLVLEQAEAALRGEGAALAPTTTGDSEPTVNYHFIITDPQGLLARVGADEAFTPLAIALQDGEAADYYLTLSLYARQNDPCGLRADWFTYVQGEEQRPSTLTLQGLASDACLDPMALLGLPASISQGIEAGVLDSHVSSAFLTLDAGLELSMGTEVMPSRDWIEAGDHVCSLNRVCSSFFYDGQTLGEPVMGIDFGGIAIETIATPWDDFIQDYPSQVTVQGYPSIFAVNPWDNVPPLGK